MKVTHCVTVKKNPNDPRPILEKHKDHPDGYLILETNEPQEVALTPRVQKWLDRGRLLLITEEGPNSAPPTPPPAPTFAPAYPRRKAKAAEPKPGSAPGEKDLDE